MATYAIGDIQGCYQSLRKLLNRINFDSNSDKLLLAGDLINRGPDSLKTMQFILENQANIQVVLGNHDLHFLAVAHDCQSIHTNDTFDDILQSNDCEPIVSWLSQQPLAYYHEESQSLLVHAGIPVQWTLNQTLNYAQEVSNFLQTENASQFYLSMYGNQPDQWDPELTGMDRLRYITNALTRMRYCYTDGRLELNKKSPPKTISTETGEDILIPWFELENQLDIPLDDQSGVQRDNQSYSHDKLTLLFGHWAALQGQSGQSDIIALDTGCVWGGQLTAFRLDDKQFFSVNA